MRGDRRRIDLRQAGLALDPGVYVLNATVPGQSTDRSPRASQWFMISDLGLTTWQGSDGLAVAVRGLGDAAARTGVEVQLVSRGNAVLGTARTDDQGIARFDAGLVRGSGAAAPGIVTATRREGERIADLAFLSLIDPEFDLSDRGVEGAPPAPPIDLFVALDRGAYRAGETAHATILARDGRAQALDGLPVQARVIRPDGVEHARLTPQPAGAGGHVLDFPIPASAPRGAWRIDLRVEEEGPAIASARLLVEDFRPERIDFDLTLPEGALPAGQPVQAGFDARWLFGAPAADLPVEGELRLSPARSLPGWEGYVFGRHDDTSEPDVVAMPAGRTDAAGHFAARIDLPTLLRVFFATHDPTTLNRQGADVGTQYRSGIYVQDEEQGRMAREVIEELTREGVFPAPIVTEVQPLASYWPAEPEHQRYFERHPHQGYCSYVIAPKVAKLRQQYAKLLRPGA